MASHFSTVPVDIARRATAANQQGPPLPLVLVVDDEPLIAETLAAILNGSGLAAFTAGDGKSALEFAGLIPPNILITDIAMPGMSGVDLAIEVSRKVKDCELILFSGQSAATDAVASLQEEGRHFVTLAKPVHPKDLLASVFELISKCGLPVPERQGTITVNEL